MVTLTVMGSPVTVPDETVEIGLDVRVTVCTIVVGDVRVTPTVAIFVNVDVLFTDIVDVAVTGCATRLQAALRIAGSNSTRASGTDNSI